MQITQDEHWADWDTNPRAAGQRRREGWSLQGEKPIPGLEGHWGWGSPPPITVSSSPPPYEQPAGHLGDHLRQEALSQGCCVLA